MISVPQLSNQLMHDYGDLLWWWANRMARTFGGRSETYIGTVYIHAATAWKYYDPSKGKFRCLHHCLLKKFLDYDHSHHLKEIILWHVNFAV